MNPISDITTAVETIVQAHRLDKWLQWCLGLFLSGLITFMILGGSALAVAVQQGLRPAYCYLSGLSAGLIPSAAVMAYFVLSDPLSKNVIRLIFPKAAQIEQIISEAQPETENVKKK